MDALLQSILAKYRSEYSPEAYNTTIPPRTTLTVGVNVRNPWVAYPFRIGGYSSNQSLPVSFLDANGNTKFSWTYFPDTFAWFDIVPIVRTFRLFEQGTHNSVEGNFFIDFANATYDNIDISLVLDIFLIERSDAPHFEAEVKALYETQGEIKHLLEEIKAGIAPQIVTPVVTPAEVAVRKIHSI